MTGWLVRKLLQQGLGPTDAAKIIGIGRATHDSACQRGTAWGWFVLLSNSGFAMVANHDKTP